MNVFYLDRIPSVAAVAHNDRHVVKMIVEYAQLLSTAHRVIDAKPYVVKFSDSRVRKGELKVCNFTRTLHLYDDESYAVVDDPDSPEGDERKFVEVRDQRLLYLASHVNHPSNIWIRQSTANYMWMYELFAEVLKEYEFRTGKTHGTSKLLELLSTPPKNLTVTEPTPILLAMPDEYKTDDPVTSYQNYYAAEKARFSIWTKRKPPQWFAERVPNYDEANFIRSQEVDH